MGYLPGVNLTSVSSDYRMTLVTLLSLKVIFLERRTQEIRKNKEKEIKRVLWVYLGGTAVA